ncbi:DUF2306 domain-containing protein [Sneathiella sp.]|uniref:DUF2306 domain-containing protein n=1 Tax=Sneathiella sp. TaxID=1964365 RepID=UPI0039E3866D
MGIIWLHLVLMLGAVLLGGFNLFSEKGTGRHRLIGRIWILFMGIAAMISFEIRELSPGSYSWIHLLSVWTLLCLVIGLWAARTGRIRVHKGFMIGTYAGALVAGFFALLPGRFISQLLSGT